MLHVVLYCLIFPASHTDSFPKEPGHEPLKRSVSLTSVDIVKKKVLRLNHCASVELLVGEKRLAW